MQLISAVLALINKKKGKLTQMGMPLKVTFVLALFGQSTSNDLLLLKVPYGNFLLIRIEGF